MKRVYLASALTCIFILALFNAWFHFLDPAATLSTLKVGFIYDNDESTPYTYNFSLAKDALEKKYGDRVEILTRSNVLDDQMEEPLRDLAEAGCNIIFLNGYSTQVIALAPEYPGTEFCQASYEDMSGKDVPQNYHTFKGKIYQGRYVSGIAAGMKLNELISQNVIGADQAIIGFVAAYPTTEVISGFTAFLLGVRSVVPQAVMRVKYTESWSSYSRELSAARGLIEEGCVIISQHTDTIGPAVACEESTRPVFHVAYNQSMTEVAPTTSLVCSRINWEPYVVGAVEAVMSRKRIEAVVPGRVHGSDMSAGFESGWVEVLELNQQIAAEGTQEAMDAAIARFRREKGNDDFVFRGEYVGVNPNNPADTCDLRKGFVENEFCSHPSFGYILSDIITID